MLQELQQKDLFYGFNSLEIKKGKYLNIDRKQTAKRLQYCIDLVSLDPESRLTFDFAWRWLLGLIFSGLILFILIWFSSQIFTPQLIPYKNYLISTAGFMCLVSLLMLYFGSKRSRIFKTRHSGFPLIEVYVGKPNHKSYVDFIDNLENNIIMASQKRHLDKANQRAGELKMLRRLSQEGVVSKIEYEDCKYLLLHS